MIRGKNEITHISATDMPLMILGNFTNLGNIHYNSSFPQECLIERINALEKRNRLLQNKVIETNEKFIDFLMKQKIVEKAP